MQAGGRIIHPPSNVVGTNYAQILHHPHQGVHGQSQIIIPQQPINYHGPGPQPFHPGHPLHPSQEPQYLDPRLVQHHQQQQHFQDQQQQQQHYIDQHIQQQQYLDQQERLRFEQQQQQHQQQAYLDQGYLDNRTDQYPYHQPHLPPHHHHLQQQQPLAPGGYDTGSLDDPAIIIGSTSQGPGQQQYIERGGGGGYPSGPSLPPRRVYPSSSGIGLVGGGMSELEEQECKIVNEFCHLLEKSKQLFNGLRDLPQYGHKQWQPYFGRTFDVYTKLWRFQQQHRPVLDTKYGLKRWQIGEIASKIGQLYYHYYLRTSETNYLNEAYSFYAAIRGRGYYSKATKEERPDLMVKKLRYYARFIVVCLLLKKMKLVRDLVRELAKHIDDYSVTYEPDDQLEWNLVLSEIKSFIEADNVVTVVDLDNIPMILSHRLGLMNTPPLEKITLTHLSLQEIIIVGNVCDQVKFSELTLDMFRMLQLLEREPQPDMMNQQSMYDASPGGERMMTMTRMNVPGHHPVAGSVAFNENGERIASSTSNPYKRDNPHKYLLYRPTFSQLFVFLASGFKELPANGVLLLYLSSDGVFANIKHPEDYGYDFGGVITNSRLRDDHPKTARNLQIKDMHCLYPGDLYPFTRKAFFLIVDSDNSNSFQHIPRYFGQPFLVLMSPEEAPSPFHDLQHKGSLFTLFLHSPLTAICLISNIIEVPVQLWDRAQQQIDRFIAETGRLLVRSRSLDPVFIQFYSDDFLRLLMLRFIFCSVVLRMHRLFRSRNFHPRSHPPIPEIEFLENHALRRAVIDLAMILDIRSMFSDLDEIE